MKPNCTHAHELKYTLTHNHKTHTIPITCRTRRRPGKQRHRAVAACSGPGLRRAERPRRTSSARRRSCRAGEGSRGTRVVRAVGPERVEEACRQQHRDESNQQTVTSVRQLDSWTASRVQCDNDCNKPQLQTPRTCGYGSTRRSRGVGARNAAASFACNHHHQRNRHEKSRPHGETMVWRGEDTKNRLHMEKAHTTTHVQTLHAEQRNTHPTHTHISALYST